MFSSKNKIKKYFALMTLTILLGSVALGILIPLKEAQAIRATLGQQIVQYLMDKAAWLRDYAIQKLTSAFSQITSQIQQWFKLDTLLQRAMKLAWSQLRRQLLETLSNDIIEWAQGTPDNPNFVTDWGEYLGGLVWEAGYDFVEGELGQGYMCPTFDQYIKNAAAETSFQEQTMCPLEDDRSFLDDFTQGGLDAWSAMIQPSGNVYGSYMIAMDKKLTNETQTYMDQRDKLLAGQAFKGTNTTPGVVQSYATQRASMMDFDYLLQSDDIEEYLSSIIDAFINRIIREGLESMRTSDYAHVGLPPSYSISTIPAANKTLATVQSEEELLNQLKTLLALTKENLTELVKELQADKELADVIYCYQRSYMDTCGFIASTPINANIWIMIFARMTGTPPDIDITGSKDIIDAYWAKYGDEISFADIRRSVIDQVIAKNDALIREANNVLSIKDSGDQQAINNAIQIYNLALSNAIGTPSNNVGTFGDLLDIPVANLVLTTVSSIHRDLNQMNIAMVDVTSKMSQLRGSPVLTPAELTQAIPPARIEDSDLDALYQILRQFVSSQSEMDLPETRTTLYGQLYLERNFRPSCNFIGTCE